MGSLYGFCGQSLYNFLDRNHQDSLEQSAEPGPSLLDRLMSSKFSPVTKLTDVEYAQMLKEKVMRVQVEIDLLDDEIKELEAQKIGSPQK